MILAAASVPGANVALIFSFILTVAMTLVIIPLAKRRPPGTPLSWGQAMIASLYAFALMFLAYGVVPNAWLAHADNELAWRADQIYIGHSASAQFVTPLLPFDVSKQTLRDIVVVVIYGLFFGLQVYVWVWWQKRGKVKPAATELPTSTYGRPLVRKG